MAEIIKCYRDRIPAHRFIGKCYFDGDRDETGGFGAKWGEWFQQGWFGELEKLGTLEENEGAYIGLMRFNKKKPFQYWIGIFFPENTPVPDGFKYVDFSASDLGICWVHGSEKNDNIFQKHEECFTNMRANGYEVKNDFGSGKGEYWFFERYNCPRFTIPDENNKIILDYCFYINYNLLNIKKVRVCKKCSGFNVTELKGKVRVKDYSTGCIGKCVFKYPELGGKVYGFLNGKFTVCDTKDEFFEKIAGII